MCDVIDGVESAFPEIPEVDDEFCSLIMCMGVCHTELPFVDEDGEEVECLDELLLCMGRFYE